MNASKPQGNDMGYLKQVPDDQSAWVCCPHCGLPLLTMTRDGLGTPEGKPWLHDGDAVPGVEKALSSGGGAGGEAFLMVGSCPTCNGAYWCAEATLMKGGRGELEDYLAGAPPLDQDGQVSNYTLTTMPVDVGFLRDLAPFQQSGQLSRTGAVASWWMVEEATPRGPVHQHTFGPFGLEDADALRGPAGVSACGQMGSAKPWRQAADRLLAAWPVLVRIHEAASTENVQ